MKNIHRKYMNTFFYCDKIFINNIFEEKNMNGKFIAFEGIDGSGKSTQLRLLAEKLHNDGISCYVTREPTDSPTGSLIHSVMTGRIKMDSRATAALFTADRIDHVTNGTDGLINIIKSGKTVLTDRFYFSSYAYQSADIPMDDIIFYNKITADILKPDINIFIDVPVSLALKRISEGRTVREIYETEERLAVTRENYFKAFEKCRDSEKIVTVNGESSEEEISDKIYEIVKKLYR